MVEHLHSIHKGMGSIPSIEKAKHKNKVFGPGMKNGGSPFLYLLSKYMLGNIIIFRGSLY
jgi:hypothetical protein